MDKITQGITNLPISGTVEGLVSAIIAGAVAYLWYRFRRIDKKMEESVSREEVKEMIEDKVKHIEFMVNDINSDVKRMDYKLDKVLTALLQSKQGE
jgi:membrane protein implicated in regulation of membrane protease activity